MSATEYIDIVDEQGLSCGIKKPRDIVHHHGDWHRTVHVWIVNTAQEILFQKRSLHKESYPGIWDVSAAGHISAGDSSVDSAIKEVKEELGLYISKSDLVYLYTMKNSLIQDNGQYVDNEFSDVYVVWMDVVLDTLQLQESEVSDVTYVSLGELKRIADNGDNAFVPREDEYMRLYEFIVSKDLSAFV